VPTDVQLNTLMTYSTSFYGNSSSASMALKLPPGEFWDFSQTYPFGAKGTNATGFAALGSGIRDGSNGSYGFNKQWNYLMSRIGGINKNIHTYRVEHDEYDVIDLTNSWGGDGYTIRCIKIE